MTLLEPRRCLPEDILDFEFAAGEITTITGRIVKPWDMGVYDFCLEDIGHALSQLCRYAGHVPSFYSVAEHCVWVYESARGAGVDHMPTLRAAFLHDASEAYLVDVPAPVKKMPAMRPYVEAEDRLQVKLGNRYGFNLFHPDIAEVVKHHDQEAYRFETRFHRQGLIVGLQPVDAKHEWWRVANELGLTDD
jgi:hypothetical protein